MSAWAGIGFDLVVAGRRMREKLKLADGARGVRSDGDVGDGVALAVAAFSLPHRPRLRVRASPPGMVLSDPCALLLSDPCAPVLSELLLSGGTGPLRTRTIPARVCSEPCAIAPWSQVTGK